MPGFETYLSPYSWRYGSEEMRSIWSEVHKRKLWRQIWVAVAEVQSEMGLVSEQQVDDLRKHSEEVDLERALQIEREIHHDLVAEVKAFAEQCRDGGGIIHLGLTSMDVVDHADLLRIRASLNIVIFKLEDLLRALVVLIEQWADKPVMGYTHLQAAEPTTLGYRLAQYAQDLFTDWMNLRRERTVLRGKGFRGAVGTGASIAAIDQLNLVSFNDQLSKSLQLPFFLVSTQVYPRKQDYQVLCSLAGLGASLHKMAFDLRILQSPPFGELGEPFGEKQVGSSAMPFKRNPILSEKINSLTRLLAQLPRVAWDNAANSLLERTLDDSANRRVVLPEAFLAADEILLAAAKIIAGLRFDELAMAKNMQTYGPFAATERVLMVLVKAGADRQEMHERLRGHALRAWEAIQSEEDNPLMQSVAGDPEFQRFITLDQLLELMNADHHIGDAPERTRELARTIKKALEKDGQDEP